MSNKMNRNQKAMLFAEGIVERYKARGNQLPHRSKTCRLDPSRVQEYKDAAKLNDWKQSLKGNRGTCPNEIRDFLDFHIPNWRTAVRSNKVDSDSDGDGDADSDTASQSSANSSGAKRKRQQREDEEKEDEEEVARQILRDSQLLLEMNRWSHWVLA